MNLARQVMCGIAGIADFEGRLVSRARRRRVTELLRHRGPDGEGIWTGQRGHARVGFGRRRLVVLDLRACAAQPMQNAECVAASRG